MSITSTTSGAPSSRLVLQHLTEDAWRLCDSGAAPDDAASLIAYVERTPDGAYHAVWVGLRSGTTHHADLDDILAVAGELMSADQPRSTKPIQISSRSPFADERRDRRRSGALSRRVPGAAR